MTNPERTSYADKVRAGVALLDDREPGWYGNIDVACLDMDHCFRCVLGQVFGNYLRGADQLQINPGDYGFDVDMPYGFSEDTDRFYYRLLTRLWTYVIRKRQEADWFYGLRREAQDGES